LPEIQKQVSDSANRTGTERALYKLVNSQTKIYISIATHSKNYLIKPLAGLDHFNFCSVMQCLKYKTCEVTL